MIKIKNNLILVFIFILTIVLPNIYAKRFNPHVDLRKNLRLTNSIESALKQNRHGVKNNIDYQWFTQTLDHFDQQNTATFQQRYLVNDAYWDGKGPVFMLVNGEGPMVIGMVLGLKYVEWAQQFNCLIVSLEHRYYGISFPTPDLSTKNLQYLSSQQALADNARFREFITKTYNVSSSSKWVSFGGSYSGALTSWFRLKYPNLVDYTISSSAPVLAELNFYQYLEVVQRALLTTPNGQQCIDNIQMATQKIQGLVQSSDGLKVVSDLFNLCPQLETKEDVSSFMNSLAGNFMGTVQYNLESPTAFSINQLCDIMTNQSNDPVTNYVNVWNGFSEGCTDVTYQTMIEEMKNETNAPNVIGGRQWFYQTCTEFGYYQSSDSQNQPFGDLFPIDYLVKQCFDVFGFNFTPNIDWTLTDYGGLTPQISDIIYVNGDNDPWSALSITNQPSSTLAPSLLIHGTSHCADMEIPNALSPPSLIPAQKVIEGYLTKWLTGFTNAPTTPK